MKSYELRFYRPEDYKDWNAFVQKAKNATFLFHRDYMDYHKDRFDDCSLVITENNKWVAVFPANRVEDEFRSHYGLTYGGLVLSRNTQLTHVVTILKHVFDFLKENNFKTLKVKTLPSMYAAIPSEELHYVFTALGAKLFRRDSLSVINLREQFKLTTSRKQSADRGIKHQLVIQEETVFDRFWNELHIPNLERKYGVRPIHSLEEITYLHSKFPENIRQFNVYHEGKIVAGTTLYVTDRVVHCQYIASNEDKNKLGSLDFLFRYLIQDVFKEKQYFDLGASNDYQGRSVVYGMQFWKQSFDAHTFIQDFYELSLDDVQHIDSILK